LEVFSKKLVEKRKHLNSVDCSAIVDIKLFEHLIEISVLEFDLHLHLQAGIFRLENDSALSDEIVEFFFI
jgi:hypothetical protein